MHIFLAGCFSFCLRVLGRFRGKSQFEHSFCNMFYFFSFLSNILFLTGAGGIILLVIVPDRYTATKKRKKVSEHWGRGWFGEVGWLAAGQDVQREKGQRCRKWREANEWLLERTHWGREGPPSLSHWDRGQRSEAHNIRTYLPRYVRAHMQTLCTHEYEHTQMWHSWLTAHRWLNSDFFFYLHMLSENQMSDKW